ncbi:flavocytochrome C [Novimethylophilus kurashikiensis]|uniref:Flavocytochrome C n=1 Tax=Novimethylophilus kurashikiensis TaxID=1825523 RepID=A0A2R5FCG4_9PROT|nr:flavocytochrome C [Novimethylophilus kurashikiensis]
MLAAYGGYEIWQEAGSPHLTQDHLDIWLLLIKASYDNPLNQSDKTVTVSFGYREMLRHLGKTGGGADMAWLRDKLTEMRMATYRITCGEQLTVTGLVHKFTQSPGEDGRYEVLLDAELRNLFSAGWTQLNLAHRLALAGRTSAHVLAQWLHAFYSTHRSPVPLGTQKIQMLCGRAEMEAGKFNKLLQEAIEHINNSTIGWKCEVNNGVVSVKKGSHTKLAQRAGHEKSSRPRYDLVAEEDEEDI